MAMKDVKARLLADYEAKIAEVNKVCAKGTNAEVEGKLSELKNIENEYRALHEKEVFMSCADVHEALEKHHFTTISHKKVSEDGLMTGVEKSERMVQIDLRKFCEDKGLDMGWYYEMQALNKRLTLKAATELGVSAKEMKSIDDSYCMDKLAKEIDLGKTPTSDTQCVKHMQKVLDSLSEGEGRVNGHDLAYVWLCYAKKNNKTSLRVICSKHTILQSLLMDVFHRVVTNGSYGVDHKRVNTVVEGSEPKTEPAKPEKQTTSKKNKQKGQTTSKKTTKVSEPETVVVKKDATAA